MSVGHIDRRALLRVLGAISLVSATSPAALVSQEIDGNALGIPEIDLDAMQDLAKAYTALDNDADGVASMTARLQQQDLTSDSFVATLREEVREDFASGTVVKLSGWHLSRTEARLLAAAANLAG